MGKKRAFASLLLLLALFAGCRQSDRGASIKPPGVPGDALRIGGADGGVYVQLSKLPSDPIDCYRASVFEERSGTLWYKGKLKLVPNGNAAINVHDPDLFSGWDGDALLLKDGRKLVKHK